MNIQTIPFNTFSLMNPRPQEWFEAMSTKIELYMLKYAATSGKNNCRISFSQRADFRCTARWPAKTKYAIKYLKSFKGTSSFVTLSTNGEDYFAEFHFNAFRFSSATTNTIYVHCEGRN